MLLECSLTASGHVKLRRQVGDPTSCENTINKLWAFGPKSDVNALLSSAGAKPTLEIWDTNSLERPIPVSRSRAGCSVLSLSGCVAFSLPKDEMRRESQHAILPDG